MRSSAGVLLTTLMFGCANEATQVLVTLSAEAQVSARADELRIRILDSEGLVARSETIADPIFQLTRAMAPRAGDASRRYTLEATALENGATLTTARVSGQYTANRRIRVSLVLLDGCIGTNCVAPLTCVVTNNRPECVNPNPPMDDAGVDSGADSSFDVIRDSGRDAVVIDGCVAQCSGRTCGDDGCNGSCGVCPGGVCLASGTCAMPPNSLWTYQFTGAGDDVVQSVTVLDDRSVVVVGAFSGLSVHNGQNVQAEGGQAAFVARISAGGAIMWDTIIDGPASESADGVAIVGNRVAIAGVATGNVRIANAITPHSGTSDADTFLAFVDVQTGAPLASPIFVATSANTEAFTQFASDGTSLYGSIIRVADGNVITALTRSWSATGSQRWQAEVVSVPGYRISWAESSAQIGATSLALVVSETRLSPTCSDRARLFVLENDSGQSRWSRTFTSTGCTLEARSASVAGETVALTGHAGSSATNIAPGMDVPAEASFVAFFQASNGDGMSFRGSCFQRFGHFDGTRVLTFVSSETLIQCNGGLAISNEGGAGWIAEGTRSEQTWYRNLGTGLSGVADIRAYGDTGLVHVGYFSTQWTQDGRTLTPRNKDGYVQVRAPQ